jgi:hypothetical protein
MHSLSRRSLAVILLVAPTAAFLARFVDASTTLAWAIRVVLPALAVAIGPGAAVALAALPRRSWTVTEFVVVAFGISAAIVQLATIVALVAHLSPVAILACGFAVMCALAVRVATTSGRAPAIVTNRAEIALWVLLAVLGVYLYAQGSPFFSGEDYLHLGIIRRLASLSRPALHNIYFAPGVIYTYPFPGIHYLVALISRLGDVDAIFVYHKLRFLWGLVAVSALVLVGTRIFSSAAVGLACGCTAVAFIAAGTFATVPPLFWGQLVPYSHASDVAMGVLLPVTLAFATTFLLERERRDADFFVIGTGALVLMLSIVHIREVVQLAVYLAAYAGFLFASRSDALRLRRTALLLGITIVIAGGITYWQEHVVTHVGSVVSAQRADLVRIVRSASFLELLQPPLSLSSLAVNYDTLFWGWNPFLLVASVPVLLAFRRSPLVWFVLTSLLCYLLIIRFPLFGFPYIYLTYFEILFTPVRNVILFLQLIAGAALFLLATACSRLGVVRGSVAAAAMSAAVAVLWHLPRTFLSQHQDALMVPVIVSLAMAITFGRRAADTARDGTKRRTGRFVVLGTAAASIVVALVITWQITGRPAPMVHVRWADDVSSTKRVLEEARFRLVKDQLIEGTSWSYALVDPSPENVRALVQSPTVRDTHEIDRERFTINPKAPRGGNIVWAGSRLPVIGTPVGFDMTLLALIGVAAFAFWRAGLLRVPITTPLALPGDQGVLFGGMVFALAWWTFTPSLSPLVTRDFRNTPMDTATAISCAEKGPYEAPFAPPGVHVIVGGFRSCPPPPDLMAWVKDNVAPDAVFAANTWNDYPPSVFLPQQYYGWPGTDRNFLNPDELFGSYLPFYKRALKTHGVQPFFNAEETVAERSEFVETLGVTHVLVDPAFHDVLVDALKGNDMFEKQYDMGGWAVFRVRRSS